MYWDTRRGKVTTPFQISKTGRKVWEAAYELQKEGRAPSFPEIAKSAQVSIGSVDKAVKVLVAAGKATYTPGVRRSLKVKRPPVSSTPQVS
jgi:Mn-dependent DtxR family transcriptional regulator